MIEAEKEVEAGAQREAAMNTRITRKMIGVEDKASYLIMACAMAATAKRKRRLEVALLGVPMSARTKPLADHLSSGDWNPFDVPPEIQEIVDSATDNWQPFPVSETERGREGGLWTPVADRTIRSAAVPA